MNTKEVAIPQAWKVRAAYKKGKFRGPATHTCSLFYPVIVYVMATLRDKLKSRLFILQDSTEKQIRAHAGQIFRALTPPNQTI